MVPSAQGATVSSKHGESLYISGPTWCGPCSVCDKWRSVDVTLSCAALTNDAGREGSDIKAFFCYVYNVAAWLLLLLWGSHWTFMRVLIGPHHLCRHLRESWCIAASFLAGAGLYRKPWHRKHLVTVPLSCFLLRSCTRGIHTRTSDSCMSDVNMAPSVYYGYCKHE